MVSGDVLVLLRKMELGSCRSCIGTSHKNDALRETEATQDFSYGHLDAERKYNSHHKMAIPLFFCTYRTLASTDPGGHRHFARTRTEFLYRIQLQSTRLSTWSPMSSRREMCTTVIVTAVWKAGPRQRAAAVTIPITLFLPSGEQHSPQAGLVFAGRGLSAQEVIAHRLVDSGLASRGVYTRPMVVQKNKKLLLQLGSAST